MTPEQLAVLRELVAIERAIMGAANPDPDEDLSWLVWRQMDAQGAKEPTP